MQKTRRENERAFPREAVGGSSPQRWKAETYRVFASAACISFALAACGGNGGSDSTSTATPSTTATAPQSLEATAALAAKSTTLPLAMSLKMNASGLSSDASVDRFIVKYKSGTIEGGSTTAVQSRLDRLAGAFPSKAHHLRRMGIGSDVITTERKLNAREAKAFMRAIASDPDVEYVEPDVPVSINSAPNDPFYNVQWGLFSNLDPGQSNVGIRAASAWTIATGAGVTIGLVDNGVTSHNDLNANILPYGYDFTFLGPPGGSNPGIGNGKCQISYHGTHVAGIMAAVTNNSIGIAGVAPSAKIISARTLNDCGTGLLSSSSDAMLWASGGPVPGFDINPHPVNVINASLSAAGQCSRAFQDSIDYATSHGVIVVVAAGNNNADAMNNQPGNCRGVIAVGNTQPDGSRASDSNYGPIVDVAAPGTNIYSTYNAGTSSLGAESYAYMSGTSMATPMVSGVVALVKSVAPTPLSAAEMRTLITRHAQRFPKKPDQPLGSGILDATATVTAAKAGEIPAAADFQCSQSAAGMLVTCTDRSTSRGVASIKSWAWDLGFGDPNDMVRTQSVNPYYDYEYPGTYNITLTVTDSMGAVSRLSRPFTVIAPAATELSSNIPVKFSANYFIQQFFSLDVPAGVKTLTFTLSPASYSDLGTLYLRASSPTTRNADCQSVFVRGGAATCTISNPAPGTYYGTVNPNSNLTDAAILATYTK
ncbi:S8 family serine peptidase [Paraburkholderia sediminicola]|uniref:S8 family serine peptidase n=1 Tax=Paraburkholderia sediminicola TaxID=458836 RepID=UPI0038BA827F